MSPSLQDFTKVEIYFDAKLHSVHWCTGDHLQQLWKVKPMEKRISNLVRQEVISGGKVSSGNHYRTAAPTPKLKLLLFAISAQQKYSYILLSFPAHFHSLPIFTGLHLELVGRVKSGVVWWATGNKRSLCPLLRSKHFKLRAFRVSLWNTLPAEWRLLPCFAWVIQTNCQGVWSWAKYSHLCWSESAPPQDPSQSYC